MTMHEMAMMASQRLDESFMAMTTR
jgi:hypothetical protein